ncbi:hypothetical protein PMAYCL1PPCAC_16676, partial [Pristionchus mayeri]
PNRISIRLASADLPKSRREMDGNPHRDVADVRPTTSSRIDFAFPDYQQFGPDDPEVDGRFVTGVMGLLQNGSIDEAIGEPWSCSFIYFLDKIQAITRFRGVEWPTSNTRRSSTISR